MHGLYGIDSEIISQEQYELIQKWLPPKYQTLKPKLLYRGQADNMDTKSFHTECDGKGATVTLMSCGSIVNESEGFTVGGFLDESWNSSNQRICSKEAFLFSVTGKVKFPLIPGHERRAAYGSSNYGPTFGQGNDLCLKGRTSKFEANQHSYANSEQLTTTILSNSNEEIRTWREESSRGEYEVIELEVFGLSV